MKFFCFCVVAIQFFISLKINFYPQLKKKRVFIFSEKKLKLHCSAWNSRNVDVLLIKSNGRTEYKHPRSTFSWYEIVNVSLITKRGHGFQFCIISRTSISQHKTIVLSFCSSRIHNISAESISLIKFHQSIINKIIDFNTCKDHREKYKQKDLIN